MRQHILAIDDEPHMLKLLERIIGDKTPYQLTTTNNSLELPDLLEETQFDLILTDLKMPGMDGMDILRLVKEKERYEEVIIITAFGSMETAIKALSMGVFDYITKPFKKEQILYTLERAMKWQLLKKESAQMEKIFEKEPFDEAIKAFEMEYLQRLAKQCNADISLIAERSGLSEENITLAINHEA